MNSSQTIETFTAQRQFLFSIAYRMLGSLSEAEDMVQEVWLRWQTQDVAAFGNDTPISAIPVNNPEMFTNS